MYYEEEDIFYYITLMNENYEMPILPMGSTEGICRGIYKLSSRDLGPKKPKVQLFGSGAILRESLRAQELAGKAFRRRQQRVQRDQLQIALLRRPRVRPLEPPASATSRRVWPYVSQALQGESGPVVAALDYVSAVGLSIAPWVMRR